MPSKDKMISFIFLSNLILVIGIGFLAFSKLNFNRPISFSTSYDEEADYIAENDFAPEPLLAAASAPRGGGAMPLAKRMAPSSPSSIAGSLMVSTAEASVRSKYIIKNGNIRGRVDSLEKTKEKIPEILKTHDAYIFSENESNSNYSKDLSINIKVPAKNFDSIVNDLAKITTHLDSKSSNIKDVMKQFIETEERIKSRTLLRDKFRKLITQSKRVEDTLKIEQQLSSIQHQIESSKRVLENLKQQIAVSSIQVSFYETKPVSAQKPRMSFIRQLLDALSNGWRKLRGTVLFIISLWPFLIIFTVAFIAFRRYKKRKNS